ncbi:MAG TPA: hypothetical protein VL463_09695 [Kofleriaceae bacterium]|nr:hypothetical protein [Kofleriaceae bacterium]
MRRAILVASLSSVIALQFAAAAWPRGEREREHERERGGRELGDERSKHPGIHRMSGAELAVRNRVAREESLKIEAQRLARKNAAKPSVPATSWVNLGPADAPQEFNYFKIAGVDSGRPNAIVVDPRDPNVVYMAVSGGGLWKTFDFLAEDGPHWAPTMDTQPNLAVGALALDPANPDVLYVGNGDFIDSSGNTILKSSDGGGTWAAPVVVSPFVSSVRQIQVSAAGVFAATDQGLFVSTDAGASFTPIDLPNGDMTLAESLWSIVPIGGGGWVAAGVTACAPGFPAPGGLFGSDPDPQFCPAGNNVAFWRTDDGTTWSQVTATPPTAGTGRTTIAAGPTNKPDKTVVYAYVGAVDGSHTVGFWRSDDAGKTWVDATGALANPTLVDPNQDDSCIDMDVGHGQSWYNQAIVVDPTNADHVLVGGNLCGVRTLDGTSDAPKWELVSHWLPGNMYGETAGGRLGYVHADWHTATSVVFKGKVTTFAGTDGGIFSSDNVFDDASAAESVVWTHHNRGLATHLMYALASGDPADGNAFVLFAGLQDNGTRFRTDPKDPSGFNQPVGGDGIGCTVHTSSSGTTYWASVEFARVFCQPDKADCATEKPEAMTDEEAHWHSPPSPVGPSMEEDAIEARMEKRNRISGEDSEPFLEHYANVETDTVGQSVLSHTDEQVFVSVPDGNGGFVFQPVSQSLDGDAFGGGISNVTASRAFPELYGAAGAVSREPFLYTTHGNSQVDWTITQPVFPVGDAKRLTGPSSIDFPPSLPQGKNPGDIMVGAFTGTMNDQARTPPPDDKGHLYRSTDGGQTWTSIVGADPAHRLPNVPVYVVKYDPVTPTTLYAGTELGIYFTTDDAATWNRMGDNFPMVPVRDIYVAKNQEFIRVATYGRGLWEIYPSADASHGAPGNGDYDRNLRIDWIDVAAMSTRLGETPEATTAPLFSWIMDIVGSGDSPTQKIDDDDMTALLAKFGGHP